MRDRARRLVVGARGEPAAGPGEDHDDAGVVVGFSSASTSRSGTITSKAMEFIRSGRLRVTRATWPRTVDEDEIGLTTVAR